MPPCPACEGRAFRPRFTKKGRDFWRCRGCGLERQFPGPDLGELRAYYEASYTDGLYREFADATSMKTATALWRLRAVVPHCRPGRWLDVGAANGVFVELARARGVMAEGVELSELAVAEARGRGLPVARAAVEDYAPGYRYDTITCFDVLEHVLDPAAFLRAVHGLLEPGGILALTLPDLGSVHRMLMGSRWYFYIPDEHLHYFDRTSLERLLSRSGFSVLRWGRALKPLSYRYSLTQLKEYNPLLYRLARAAAILIPRRLLDLEVPLYIGEMLVIAGSKP